MIGDIDKIFNSNVKAKGTVYEYVNKIIHSAKIIKKHEIEETNAVVEALEQNIESKKTEKIEKVENKSTRKKNAKTKKIKNENENTVIDKIEKQKVSSKKAENKKVPSDKVENKKVEKENSNVGMFPEGALSRAEQCAEKQIENKQKVTTSEKTSGPIPYKVVQKERRQKLIEYFEVNEPEIGD